MTPLRKTRREYRSQQGAALMVMLVITVLGIAAFLVSSLNSSVLQNARNKVTADALAQAKEALIGYAASIKIDLSTCAAPGNNCRRLGDLPCPDINDDGIQEIPCGNASGSTGQTVRLGRLPWKTLGLPDLRDGSGERLWYAVSNNFKNSTRTSCASSGQLGCLNSDAVGTISVFASNGNILNDGGASATGAAAIIIAPGAPLTRADTGTLQNRSGAGVNAASSYLDIATVSSTTEDNANFTDGSSTNGFIQGPIQIMDSNGNVTFNDQLLVITQDNIMQPIQKRVAAEVKQCLIEYATPANGGINLYPWAAKLDPTNPISYIDFSGMLFGRIPDTPFGRTIVSNNNMTDTWTGNCNINSSTGWWLNWKEMVFYGVSTAFAPPGSSACGTCLSVNPPYATTDKKFVVLVAGKKLTGQVRNSNANKGTLSNFLEGPNSGGTSPFAQSAVSATFNDTVVFQ